MNDIFTWKQIQTIALSLKKISLEGFEDSEEKDAVLGGLDLIKMLALKAQSANKCVLERFTNIHCLLDVPEQEACLTCLRAYIDLYMYQPKDIEDND